MTQVKAWHETFARPDDCFVLDDREDLALKELGSRISRKNYNKSKAKSKSSKKKPPARAPLPPITDQDWLELFQELVHLVKHLDYKQGYIFIRIREAMPPRSVWKWWGEISQQPEEWYLTQPSRSRGAEERFQELEDHLGQLRARLAYRLRNADNS